jgi:hypothetical protein
MIRPSVAVARRTSLARTANGSITNKQTNKQIENRTAFSTLTSYSCAVCLQNLSTVPCLPSLVPPFVWSLGPLRLVGEFLSVS